MYVRKRFEATLRVGTPQWRGNAASRLRHQSWRGENLAPLAALLLFVQKDTCESVGEQAVMLLKKSDGKKQLSTAVEGSDVKSSLMRKKSSRS